METTKNKIIQELVNSITVTWKGYGTWKVTGKAFQFDACFITHNEEDVKGIFDGKKYNLYALEQLAFGDISEEEYERVCMDSANEDNYEPREQRDLRLAERLYPIVEAKILDWKFMQDNNSNN